MNPPKPKISAEVWNARYPIGTLVTFTDCMETFSTITTSQAWELGCGIPVVKIAGKSGGFALDNLTVREGGPTK